jgi:tripeptide aminopeptidase
MVFAQALEKELQRIGLTEITLDENGYLMATLPANTDKEIPTIGFIAHLDTAPDMSGRNVQPRIVNNYDGGEIVLCAEENVVLRPTEFPELLNYVGKDLIVTNGKTLLGADDKAGIAEIVTAMEYLIAHPEIKHGKIRVAFNPDEEIGKGAHKFDVEAFAAEWAYTLDGGEIGELEYENFNAAEARIHIKGRDIHPGSAKGVLINAVRIAAELEGMLPQEQKPEFTDGYDGFFHMTQLKGTPVEAESRYIIRDHDAALFEKKLELMR